MSKFGQNCGFLTMEGYTKNEMYSNDIRNVSRDHASAACCQIWPGLIKGKGTKAPKILKIWSKLRHFCSFLPCMGDTVHKSSTNQCPRGKIGRDKEFAHAVGLWNGLATLNVSSFKMFCT